ncbi:hypothetical protein T11_14462 [Trichinella zimbabwensis]|uniref:Uncharacterized protein n=1 Tax=Trichinella zimbabwensis TaxID=268475 RepID=A0A0V1HY64_9BILA|nr:hypothetical protein T11_14462 [Trichinella zimbabwensis]
MTSVLIITFTNKAEQILLKLPIYEQINFNGFCKYYIIIENFHRFKANNFTREKVKLLKSDIVIDGRESNKMNDVRVICASTISLSFIWRIVLSTTNRTFVFWRKWKIKHAGERAATSIGESGSQKKHDWLRRWAWLAKKKMAHIIFCVDYRRLNQ